jgi:O-antigen ligase
MALELAAGRLARPTPDAANETRSSVDRGLLLALAIGAAIVAGIAVRSAPLEIAASVVAFLAGIASPPVGLAVLAFMTPLKSPFAIPAPGFNTILVIAILLGSIYRLPIDRPSLRPNLPMLLLFGFLLYTTAQEVPAVVQGLGDAEAHHIGYLFVQLATLIGIVVAAAMVLRGRSPVPFLIAGLLGALVAVTLAIVVAALPAGSAGNLVDLPNATSRPVGPFGDPNYFSLFEATAIAATLGIAVVSRSSRVRALLVLVAVVLALGIVIALSRSALVALAAGLIVLAFTRGRRFGLATIGVLAVLVFVAYPLFLEQRLAADAGALPLAEASAGLQRSDAARLAAALVGPQMWASSPILGIGFGEYPLTTARYIGYSIESHNWYANVLAEQGLVGVLLWLPMLAAVAARLLRQAPPARIVGLAVFATYVVGSAFLQPPLSVQTSAFAVIAIVGALVGDWSRFTTPWVGTAPAAAPPEDTAPSGSERLAPRPAPIKVLPGVGDHPDVERGLDVLPAGLAKEPPIGSAQRHDPPKRPRRKRRVADGSHEAGDAVKDGLAAAADVRRHHRKTTRARLEQDHGEALPPGGQDEAVGGLHEGRDVGPEAEQPD